MKKKYSFYGLFLILFLIFATACEEEQVQSFSAERGVNFLDVDGGDIYTKLDRKVSLIPHYVAGNFDFLEDTINILVKIEGMLSDVPLKVNVKALPVEDYATPELTFSEAIIKPGKIKDTIRVYCKPLAYLDSTFKAKIVFDYEKTEMIPGVKEQQQLILTVEDKFPLEGAMYAKNATEWNNLYAYLLGDYGKKKVRLIWSVLKGDNNAFYRIVFQGSDNKMKNLIPSFKAALKEYNDKHPDSPLKEEDGKLVTFI